MFHFTIRWLKILQIQRENDFLGFKLRGNAFGTQSKAYENEIFLHVIITTSCSNDSIVKREGHM